MTSTQTDELQDLRQRLRQLAQRCAWAALALDAEADLITLRLAIRLTMDREAQAAWQAAALARAAAGTVTRALAEHVDAQLAIDVAAACNAVLKLPLTDPEVMSAQQTARAAQHAQQQRLKALQHDPEAAWTRINSLLTQRGTRHYAETVRLLCDLAALAEKQNTRDAFTARYARFLGLHRTKKALLREVRAAGPHLAALTPQAH
ncbi:hypothetical protein [Streptomyces spectabilis]|uniref:Uncharacterized protein n=1 Tax=Streptomyces spectabilis TaxID=68270 RepID=A0A7W8F076_STRST|nr:hypothetical protein [Streptomyces spectabilis]MBB5109919.1 hypothetical protein [Streptomyces spectabilis]GGV56574.1 hypothetical protein GCM10010245_89570 [Streptomyces spectabilis]